MAQVLFLTPRFPFPLDKGDKLRAYHQIRVLSERHRIDLCALSHEPVPPESRSALEPFCDRIEVIHLSRARSWLRMAGAPLRGMPLQVAYFFSTAARRQIERLVAEWNPDHLVFQLARTAEYARGLKIPKTLDYMDAFSRGLAQRVGACNPAVRPILRHEQRAVRAYERTIFDRFDNLTIISDSDREAIDHPEKSRIRLVPNGVDLETFSPRKAATSEHVLFVGNMSYPPNVMAAQVLARQVFPIVLASRPQCRLLIAGTAPTRAVQRLRSASVAVTGWVEDIPQCYARARVFAAPMIAATGVQNKLLQAMAMAVPCVTTPLANQALGAGPDEVMLAQSAEDFAAALIQLLDDPRRARRLGLKGRELITRRFRWHQAVQPLADLLDGDAADRCP